MPEESLLQQAADFLGRTHNLAVLTGAGVSAESGVPTFRGEGGLWRGHRAEEVATPEAFARDPQLVWDFYNYRREVLAKVEPNPAHRALVALEKRFEEFALVTQNVDGLHRLAGSQHVIEVHGNIWRVRCTGCHGVFDKTGEKLPEMPTCQRCGALVRPDVVWFGETLPETVWNHATAAVHACDCLLVVGTSAVVFPAAGLAELAHHHDARVIEVNLEVTPALRVADVSLQGKAGETLPVLVERIGTRDANS